MLQPKRFYLGWFVNFTVNAWNDPWADSNGPDWTGGFYVDMARAVSHSQSFSLLPRRESQCRRLREPHALTLR